MEPSTVPLPWAWSKATLMQYLRHPGAIIAVLTTEQRAERERIRRLRLGAPAGTGETDEKPTDEMSISFP